MFVASADEEGRGVKSVSSLINSVGSWMRRALASDLHCMN